MTLSVSFAPTAHRNLWSFHFHHCHFLHPFFFYDTVNDIKPFRLWIFSELSVFAAQYFTGTVLFFWEECNCAEGNLCLYCLCSRCLLWDPVHLCKNRLCRRSGSHRRERGAVPLRHVFPLGRRFLYQEKDSHSLPCAFSPGRRNSHGPHHDLLLSLIGDPLRLPGGGLPVPVHMDGVRSGSIHFPPFPKPPEMPVHYPLPYRYIPGGRFP